MAQRPVRGKSLAVCPGGCYLFINGLDTGTECTLSKFTGNAKLGGVGDVAEDCAAIQGDLDRLEN